MSINRKSRLGLVVGVICATLVILLFELMIYEFQPNQKQILFEVSSERSPRSGGTAGFYIDLQGNVYTFETIPKTKFERSISRRFGGLRRWVPYTIRDLFSYNGSSSQLVGKIDSNTLSKMTSLIQPASVGELSYDDPLTPKGCYSRDAGTIKYQAYLYDDNFKTQTPVELYSMGDFKQVNLSQDGRFLHKWLESVCTENNYFSGCNPHPDTCKP